MRYRPFGNTGLRVSELFLGAMTFGEQGGVGAPIEECRRMLDLYAEAGGNVVDTAINYRGGALYLGISDAPAWVVSRANTLAEWRGWSPLAGLQVPYSLLGRDIERELLPMAEAFGMSVAAWSPLGGGVLSGKFARGVVGPGSRVSPDSVSARDLGVAKTVQEVAGELGVTSAQVAIAWTRARSRVVHPIVGARSVAQLADNLAAVAVELPVEAVRRLEEASGFVAGFPVDFIAQTSPWVFGEVSRRVDGR
ncbi:aldo/keto reductase [Nonomuraea sp. RK-328]|nr:aldo/keto reductase [Nonomuraea sp. RK-328]